MSTRPLSGASGGDTSARSMASMASTTFFADQSAVLSLSHIKGGDRPIPIMVDHLVEAAYSARENRKLLHPQTNAYQAFNWRIAKAQADASTGGRSVSSSGRCATDASLGRSSTGGLATSLGTGPRPTSCGYQYGGGVRTESGSGASTSASAHYHGTGAASGGGVSGCSRGTSALSSATGLRSSTGTGTGASLGPVGWEAQDLEVVCMYDSNFQTANLRGQHGVPLRVPASAHIGPVSYVYRWYCKRATQFIGSPSQADMPDAPAMPPSANNSLDAVVGRRSDSARARDNGGTSLAALAASLTAAPPPRRAASTGAGDLPTPLALARLAASSSPPATATSSLSARSDMGDGARRTTSGRRLNRNLDPVMNVSELMDLLEDLQVVPHLASRGDVTKLFSISRQAAPGGSAARGPSHQHHQRPPTATPRAGGGAPSSPPVGVVKAQPHPDEIRFPAFQDLMVRLAVAIACCDSPTTAPAAKPPAAPWNGAAIPRTGDSDGQPPEVKPSLQALAQGWARSLSAEEAVGAVRLLLGVMRLSRSDLLGLKQRLDALARMAGEVGARAKSNKLIYVTGPSALAAAAGVQVAAAPILTGVLRPPAAPGAPPVAAGAAAGTSYGMPSPWTVTSPLPAPAYLLALLSGEDRGDTGEYRPAWREFGSAALDLGLLSPGELRACRLVLINRGTHQLAVKVEGGGAPFCRCTYSGLQSMPPGMPKHVEVSIQLAHFGEVVGEVRLVYTSARDRHREERVVVVPVYGMVGLPGGAALGGMGGRGPAQAPRRAPRAPSERSALAARTAREGLLPPSVAAGAALAGPLLHNVPRRSSSARGHLALAEGGVPMLTLTAGSTAGSRLGSRDSYGGGSSASWFRGSRTGSGTGESWYGDMFGTSPNDGCGGGRAGGRGGGGAGGIGMPECRTADTLIDAAAPEAAVAPAIPPLPLPGSGNSGRPTCAPLWPGDQHLAGSFHAATEPQIGADAEAAGGMSVMPVMHEGVGEGVEEEEKGRERDGSVMDGDWGPAAGLAPSHSLARRVSFHEGYERL